MLEITINGQPRSLDLDGPAALSEVLEALALRADRIAVERDGEIVPRAQWSSTAIASGERLEVVHFVGGGTGLPGSLGDK